MWIDRLTKSGARPPYDCAVDSILFQWLPQVVKPKSSALRDRRCGCTGCQEWSAFLQIELQRRDQLLGKGHPDRAVILDLLSRYEDPPTAITTAGEVLTQA